MMWEFEAAYPYLRPGGLLFADDALWNDAFHDLREWRTLGTRAFSGALAFYRKV